VVFFFFFNVILVIITPKEKNQKVPESQEAVDVCFQRSELNNFHKTVFLRGTFEQQKNSA